MLSAVGGAFAWSVAALTVKLIKNKRKDHERQNKILTQEYGTNP